MSLINQPIHLYYLVEINNFLKLKKILKTDLLDLIIKKLIIILKELKKLALEWEFQFTHLKDLLKSKTNPPKKNKKSEKINKNNQPSTKEQTTNNNNKQNAITSEKTKK